MDLTEYLPTLSDPVVMEKYIAVVKSIAAENPDFVYNTIQTSEDIGTCRYDRPAESDSGKIGPDCKGCLLGQAFQMVGVTSGLEFYGNISALTEHIEMNIDDFCEISIKKLFKVQTLQDMGESFGEAVKALD